MSLLNDIKAKQLELRKAQMHDKIDRNVEISLLTTLFSEASIPGKAAQRESTDAEVIAVIKKFVKNNDECMMSAGDRRDSDWCDRLSIERDVLDLFLPKQLTADELKEIIGGFVAANGIAGPKGTGLVMKMLKEQYEGLYDGKVASDIVKTVLN
jgi:uncharacterized protein YqeY